MDVNFSLNLRISDVNSICTLWQHENDKIFDVIEILNILSSPEKE